MTTTKKEQQQDPEIEYISRETYLEHRAELDQAWKELDEAKDQRDALAQKINKLDIENAALKDDLAKQEQINTNITQQFKDLYLMHEQLLEQCLNTTTATTITNGKLGQAIVNYKFVIPTTQQE